MDRRKSQEGHRKRLREKFIKSGISGFHDYEIVELLLTLGSPEPSGSDEDVTKDLVFAGNLMQIKVLDHIIIGDNKYYSFADEGLIEEYNLRFLSMERGRSV